MLQGTHRRQTTIAAFLVFLATVFLPAGAVRAAGVVGDGTTAGCTEASLDVALAGGGLVIFNCGGAATISISAEKTISADTTVDGAGQITLSAMGAAPATRLFTVQSGALLALQGLTLIGGDAGVGNGGAILNAGTTQLTNVTLRAHRAQLGGAIYNSATLILNGVTASGNQAQLGGAIYTTSAAPIPAGDTPAQLVNVTLSDNTGTNGGGGIYNDLGSIALLNTTVANNSADGGGSAILNVPNPSGASGTVTLQNSILGPGTLGVTCVGTIGSKGNNLASDSSCALAGVDDRENINPVLGPLQNNGGPMQTQAPLAGSPALDQGDPATCPSIDQRGLPRPFGPGCDSGAVEIQQTFGSLAGPWYVAPAGSDSNPCNVVIAPCKTINGAIAKAAADDAIFVAVGVYTSTTGDEVVRVAKDLTISGGWNSSFTSQLGTSTITGRITSLSPPTGQRGVTIASGADVTLLRFTIRDSAALGGRGPTHAGGGILVDGTLHGTLLNVTNNAAEVGGGIYVAASRVLYLVQSSVSANSYTRTGGGIYAQAATVTVANSTVSGNQHLQVSDQEFQLNATEIDSNQGTLVLIASTLVSAQSGWSDGTFVIRINMATIASLLSIIVGQVPCESTFGVSSFGGNVETRTTCGFDEPTDQVNTDPQLGPLQNNGGTTPTHALPLDSPALDVTTQCTWIDQRGVARPKHRRCDSGAYEYNGITSIVAALPFHSSFLLGQSAVQGTLAVALSTGSIPTPATLEYLPRDTPPHARSLVRSPLTSFDLQIYAGLIQASGVHTRAAPLPLRAPVTLTLNYQNLPAGILPASLGLAWYDPTTGGWVNLPTAVDASTRTVTVQISQLGTFALTGGPWVITLPLVTHE